MLNRLLAFPRWAKKIIFIIHDIILIFCAFWFALGLRLNIITEWQDKNNWVIFVATAFLSVVIFTRLGLYRAVIRYVSNKVLVIVCIGSVASVAVMLAAAFYLHLPLPLSVPIMYFLLIIVLLTGSRFTIRGLIQSTDKSFYNIVVIYGAGESGRQLLASIQQSNQYYVVAFVDDDVALQKTVIKGRQVYSSADLSNLIRRYGVQIILLAIPSASNQQRKKIIANLEPLSCKVLSIPGLNDLVDGNISVNNLKKVSVIELLGREPIEPNQDLMQKNIADKVVMVTGAGGSIGSELCRQIVENSPKTLVLFELSEFALYQIEQELSQYIKEKKLAVDLIPAMGSVQHSRRLTELMKTYDVQTVYHAAAYKHVPLVEYNTMEGVRNNVFGTLHCATAAIKASVETFVLISTDKAVRPTNTMGATKRMAELVLQSLAEKTDHNTQFCMVRFGNVLGSSGSVIPLFEKQIADGGPVTVTHQDITRFFMTIPEAAQLVIQAGAMGKGGDVFLLDMGEPVKMIALARQMITLSGFEVKDTNSPNGDIEIKVTGLRPGEKLYEELLISDNAQGTVHPRIMTSIEKMLAWGDLEGLLVQLERACKAFDPELVRKLLLSAPIDFQPSDHLCDLLSTEQCNTLQLK